MENILIGIDIGRAKTGVAVAYGPLAQPLTVIREKNTEKLVEKIRLLAQTQNAQKIVVGLPEGQLVQLARDVTRLLGKEGKEIVLWNETLTTKDAQTLAIAADIPRNRRKALEDAFAAALMLQSYLDGN